VGQQVSAHLRVQPQRAPPALSAVQNVMSRTGLARQKWPGQVRLVDDFPHSLGNEQESNPRRTLADEAEAGDGPELVGVRSGYSYWSTPRMFLPSSMSA